jgi:hypothetical protein
MVECRPGSAGGTPITPRNGRSATECPAWLRPIPAPASSVQLWTTGAAVTPSRSLSAVERSPQYVVPKSPGTTSSMRTAST